MKLSYNELHNIQAGASASGAFISALLRSFNIFLDMGRYFGSSVRRWVSKSACPVR